jgi:aspartate/methionine/tyrosine aminotransferase
LYERAISMGTLSKCFGLPGLRVGWCIAAPQVLEQCIRWRDYITLHLSPLVETIAAAAIAQSDVLVGPRLEQARTNLAILTAWLGGHEELGWAPPQGGVCIFPRLPTEIDVETFCHRLARERKVLLVPGSCFGHPQHVRLGFGGAAADLKEGLGRLGDLLAG